MGVTLSKENKWKTSKDFEYVKVSAAKYERIKSSVRFMKNMYEGTISSNNANVL